MADMNMPRPTPTTLPRAVPLFGSTLALALAIACTGSIQAGGSGGGSGTGSTPGGTGGAPGGGGNSGGSGGAGGAVVVGPTPRCPQVGVDAGPSVLRRLSLQEYQLTLQDLFQLGAPPSVESLPPDNERDGFRTFSAEQPLSSQHLQAYLGNARSLADALMTDTARRGRVVGCTVGAAGCLDGFIGRFGKLAYRRPLDAAEVQALSSRATTNGTDTTDQIRYVIEALLSSPSFLYRVEIGNSADALATLTSHELASRLSFAVWGRAPTAELLDQAAAGGLDTPEKLAAVTRTMLADARAQTFYQSFFEQWLHFGQLRAPVSPPAGWSDALLPAMQQETHGVLRDFAWTSGRSFLDALTAGYTRPSAALATFYGLPAPAADGTVPVPATHVRAGTGILTHASLLGAKSDGDLIAIRGNWLRKTFLCKNLNIPADLDLGELLVGLTRTEIVKKRNTEGACKGCHGVIDPIGIGFAGFDQSGRFDATIDVAQYGISPALVDAPQPAFASVADLAAKLQSMPEVSACLTNKLFVYTAGRAPAAADACAVESATGTFVAENHRFTALIEGLVTAPAFRLRRAAAPGVQP
jgi:hypothetical protein